MFKKALVLLLFAIASPAWLVMRSRYGRHFLKYLFLAWVLMSGLAYALRWQAIARNLAGEPVSLIDAWAMGAGVIYPLSGALWGVQAVLMMLHYIAIRTEDSAVPHPWFTGAFPLLPGTPRFIDMLGFWTAAFVAWMFLGPDGSFDLGLSFTIIAMILAFAILANSLRSNENTLPYRISEPKQPRRPTRITRVAPKSRSQDGLVEVFSRRDAALQRITQPQ